MFVSQEKKRMKKSVVFRISEHQPVRQAQAHVTSSAGSDSGDHDTAWKVFCPLTPDAAKDTRQYNKNMTERATTLLKCINARSEAG